MTHEQNLNMIGMVFVYLDQRAQQVTMGSRHLSPEANEGVKAAAKNDFIQGVDSLKTFIIENKIPLTHVRNQLGGCAYLSSLLHDTDYKTFHSYTRHVEGDPK